MKKIKPPIYDVEILGIAPIVSSLKPLPFGPSVFRIQDQVFIARSVYSRQTGGGHSILTTCHRRFIIKIGSKGFEATLVSGPEPLFAILPPDVTQVLKLKELTPEYVESTFEYAKGTQHPDSGKSYFLLTLDWICQRHISIQVWEHIYLTFPAKEWELTMFPPNIAFRILDAQPPLSIARLKNLFIVYPSQNSFVEQLCQYRNIGPATARDCWKVLKELDR